MNESAVAQTTIALGSEKTHTHFKFAMAHPVRKKSIHNLQNENKTVLA